MDIANLGDRIDSKVNTYSKGMMRRLLIARAIMTSPRFAIMDEVTSGLDVMNAHDIRELIREIAGSGVTVLLSSHNMYEVESLCDRVAMINKGEIIMQGTPAELKAKYDAKNLEEVFIKGVKSVEQSV
jgi:ABC-2 type transport system ATP-binding protein